jgi:hypothetical protein
MNLDDLATALLYRYTGHYRSAGTPRSGWEADARYVQAFMQSLAEQRSERPTEPCPDCGPYEPCPKHDGSDEHELASRLDAEIARREAPEYQWFPKPSPNQTPSLRAGAAAARAMQLGELTGLKIARAILAQPAPSLDVAVLRSAIAACLDPMDGTVSAVDAERIVAEYASLSKPAGNGAAEQPPNGATFDAMLAEDQA